MQNETAQPQPPILVTEEASPAISPPKKKFPLVIFIIFIVLGLAAGGIFYLLKQQSLQAVKTYEECTKAGYPATLSYPSTCRTPDGRLFVQTVSPITSPDSSPDVTFDWKTYMNEVCKIQLKYPSDWKVLKDCAEGFDCIETNDFNGSIAVTTNTTTTGTAIAVNCSTEGQPTSNEKLLQSCLKDKEKEPTNICQKVTFGTTEFINTLKGSYFSYSNGALYTINVEPIERVDTAKSELDQILSTFRFD